MEKVEKVYCALWYENAFKFNPLEILAGRVILWPWPKVTCQLSTVSKDFSSETTKPISFKFHMQPSGKMGKKVYIFGWGHMTKMAVMPIYDKN